MKTYQATGVVIGELWEPGQTGTYPIKPITGKSEEEIHAEVKRRLTANELTGTGDFFRQTGAYYTICTTTTRTVKGRDYSRKDYEEYFAGEVSDKEREYLVKSEMIFSM